MQKATESDSNISSERRALPPSVSNLSIPLLSAQADIVMQHDLHLFFCLEVSDLKLGSRNGS